MPEPPQSGHGSSILNSGQSTVGLACVAFNFPDPWQASHRMMLLSRLRRYQTRLFNQCLRTSYSFSLALYSVIDGYVNDRKFLLNVSPSLLCFHQVSEIMLWSDGPLEADIVPVSASLIRPN